MSLYLKITYAKRNIYEIVTSFVSNCNEAVNYLLQVGSDPDQIPSERQVRVDDPDSLYPLLQV